MGASQPGLGAALTPIRRPANTTDIPDILRFITRMNSLFYFVTLMEVIGS